MTGLFVLGLADVPTLLFLPPGASFFDAAGQHAFTAAVPVSLNGLSATFLAACFWKPGYVGFSNALTVEFQ